VSSTAEMVPKGWEDIVRQKREIRSSLLQPYLTPVNRNDNSDAAILEITNVEELTALFALGTLRAEDVVRCYSKRYESALISTFLDFKMPC
jgi:hypothetical protein